jgi:hypothetical protein
MKIVKVLGALIGALLVSGAAQLGSAAAPPVYPIVNMGQQCLLGGAYSGKWLGADAVKAGLRGGERYRLYSLTRYLGMGTGARPASAGPPCEDTQQLDVTPDPSASVIGIDGTWNAMPRVPRVESTNQAVYRQAAADVLKRNGIANPKVVLKQVLRVDLEGDGEKEVLVTATNYKDGIQPHAQVGDYSVVFLRKVIKGKVETTIVEGDFYTKTVEFGAPVTYNVGAIVDTNGDGVLEIMVEGEYYEGIWSSVYQVKGAKVEEVLTCGCGA